MARLVAAGAEMERAWSNQRIPRHHHADAYAALVVRGGYVEAGDRGRISAKAGDVLFHSAFEGHSDHVGAIGAEILNLPLERSPAHGFGRCADPDAVARVAMTDSIAAASLLLETTRELPVEAMDWPDILALALRRDPSLRLDRWADQLGLPAGSVSRGFRLAYGLSPKRFRLEQRAAAAARRIRSGTALADAAFATGFADQPHMTRAIGNLFGCTPGHLTS